jgi:hypothetical protein
LDEEKLAVSGGGSDQRGSVMESARLLLGRVRLVLCASFVLAALLLSAGLPASAYGDGVPLKPGDVLAGIGDGMIGHYSPTGTLLDVLNTTSGSSEDTGMCFDQAGNLYTTNFEANSMSEFNNKGNLVAASFGSGFNAHPESCVFNAAGQMFVGQADGSHQVLEFDATGKLLTTFSPTPDARGTDWIDLAADQHTLHYTSEGTLVKRFNVATNTQDPNFATGLPAPCYAHRILADGGELVACASEVVRLNASGAQIQTYAVDPNHNLFALNIDPDGTSFWTADFNGTIWHVDIASGHVINSFTATPKVDVAGLAIVGEPTAAVDQPITAKGSGPASATEGKPFSNAVATFNDPDTSAKPTDYSASINWGDGTTSAGTISGSGGNFTVTGSHTYAEEGSDKLIVTITDVDNTKNSATASTSATVSDAALHAVAGHPTRSGHTVSGMVATFTDDDPNGTVSDYTASINWGDGKSSSGSIAAGSGNFDVSGSHAYAKAGTFTVVVTIKDAGGSTATATLSVTVKATPKKPKPVVHGTAKLKGAPAACVLMPFSMQVKGKQISSVKWSVDGHRISGRTVHKGKQYATEISISPGKHGLTVKVTFRKSSHTRARTFHRTVSGCPLVSPVFTG